MVVLAEYAVLSRETYLIQDRDITYRLPDGWRVDKVRALKGIWGNRYVVFFNDVKKEIVISVRGTDNAFNILTDVGLALSRINNEPFIPPGQNELDELVSDTLKLNLIEEQGYTFRLIGHSLGAVMAELSAVKFGVECIGFESPGSLNIMRQYPSKYHEENFKLITNYLSAPNIINTLNIHPGTVYRMHLSHADGFNVWHALECLLDSLCTVSCCLSINSTPLVLFSSQNTKKLAKKIVKHSGLIALCSKFVSKIFNWHDDIKWLEKQHGIEYIAEFLLHNGKISKINSWPIIWDELKESKLSSLARDFLPLQKDKPGIRNFLDESGMREAQIKRIHGYVEEAEEITSSKKGMFSSFVKYKLK